MKGRVIGMVQTRPLPGSYRNRGERIDSITEQALEETRKSRQQFKALSSGKKAGDS